MLGRKGTLMYHTVTSQIHYGLIITAALLQLQIIFIKSHDKISSVMWTSLKPNLHISMTAAVWLSYDKHYLYKINPFFDGCRIIADQCPHSMRNNRDFRVTRQTHDHFSCWHCSSIKCLLRLTYECCRAVPRLLQYSIRFFSFWKKQNLPYKYSSQL